jgi:hypothetical protein
MILSDNSKEVKLSGRKKRCHWPDQNNWDDLERSEAADGRDGKELAFSR